MRKYTRNVLLYTAAASMLLSLSACGSKSETEKLTTAAEPVSKEAIVITTAEESKAGAAGASAESASAESASAESVSAESAESAGSTESAPAEDAVITASNGMKLTIPGKYRNLLIVEPPENDADGVLFRVFEKESVESGKRLGIEYDGIGWLFDITKISLSELHEKECHDMYNDRLFANDGKGGYYLFNTASDVRYMRDSNEQMQKDQDVWTMVCEWADTVDDAFIRDNPGLTADYRGTSLPEIYLARCAYMDGTNYTISTTEFGPMDPGNVDPEPFVEQLTVGTTYEVVARDDSMSPDGEYAVLSFPDDGLRFDFFFAEGGENYVREVPDGEVDALYKVTFASGDKKAGEIMKKWYDALVAANGGAASGEMASAEASGDAASGSGAQAATGASGNAASGTADDLLGAWAESVAGRGYIEIREGAGGYDIQVNWSSSASEMSVWQMTGVAADGRTIRYEDCRHSDLTFAEDGSDTEVVVYENGKGSFTLNDDGNIVWDDETGHAADDCVFVDAD